MQKSMKMLSQLEAYSVAKKVLIETYKTDSGKKFIHHLISSFITAPSVYVLFGSRKLFDCLTRSSLKSMFSKEEPLVDQDIQRLLETSKSYSEMEDKFKVFLEVQKLIEERFPIEQYSRIACRSRLTDKVLGMEELTCLQDFVREQVEEGNAVIKRMLNYKPQENGNSAEVEGV